VTRPSSLRTHDLLGDWARMRVLVGDTPIVGLPSFSPAPVAVPSPSTTATQTPSSPPTASPSPSPAFRDLTVSAAGELRGEHALVLQLLTSAIAGVPSQPRFWDVPLDGTAPHQIVGYTRGPQGFTDFDSFDFSRQLSSDGRQLVLADPDDVAGSGFVIVDLIAGTARKIALATGSDQPAWSPDGQRIAYRGFSIAGPYQQDAGIWVVSSAGGEPRHVVPSDLRAGSGAMYLYGWTADGSGLFFGPDPNTLSVVDVQSGQVTRIGDRTSGIAVRAKPPSVAIVFYEDTPGDTTGNSLKRNTANQNRGHGIDATTGSIDGGGNRASGNATPPQCLNVTWAG